ncbi:hypothetical protein F5B19DRAFT_452250 [Rostrohypoxylon terebratum]|nr:hypothetical protein F5B19DRAFT_452250 [Rostrohypoxylon terebratum]
MPLRYWLICAYVNGAWLFNIRPHERGHRLLATNNVGPETSRPRCYSNLGGCILVYHLVDMRVALHEDSVGQDACHSSVMGNV